MKLNHRRPTGIGIGRWWSMKSVTWKVERKIFQGKGDKSEWINNNTKRKTM